MTRLVLIVALLGGQLADDTERDTNAVCKAACDGKGERCLQRCVMCALGAGEQHASCLEACHENHVWGTTDSANCMARCRKRFETRVLACLDEKPAKATSSVALRASGGALAGSDRGLRP